MQKQQIVKQQVSPVGSHYIWFFADNTPKSMELNKVWQECQHTYKNLFYTKYDYANYKPLADALGCNTSPSFVFWYLSKNCFVLNNPSASELQQKIREWDFA